MVAELDNGPWRDLRPEEFRRGTSPRESQNPQVLIPRAGNGEENSADNHNNGNGESALEQALAHGPSGLIDKAVKRAIRVATIGPESKDYGKGATAIGRKILDSALNSTEGVLQLLSNPKAAIRVYSAFADTAAAHANVKRAVAQAALKAVKIGETDVQKDVVLAWVKSLQESYGPLVGNFCAEYGWDEPEENTMAEMNTLMKIHGLVTGVEEYRTALIGQMQNVAIARASIEGQTAEATQRTDLLPALYDARKTANFAQRRVIFQSTSHGLSVVTGLVSSAVTGAVWGALEGVVVGSQPEIDATKAKTKELFGNAATVTRNVGRGVGNGVRGIGKAVGWVTGRPAAVFKWLRTPRP